MKIRCGRLAKDQRLEITSEDQPASKWLDDGVIRWLDLEGVETNETKQLLAPLGVQPWLVDALLDPIAGRDIHWTEEGISFVLTAPAAWSESVQRPILVIIAPETVITVHAEAIPRLDVFIDRWNRAGPIHSASNLGVFLEYAEFLLQEDIYYYYALRDRAKALGSKLDDDTGDFELEPIIGAERAATRLAEAWFDNEFAVRGLRFYLPKVVPTEDADFGVGLFSETLAHFRRGIAQLDKRLQDLHGQFTAELQTLTDKRIRILTMVSVVFLPLTLIAGIYGMNFDNMPELHGPYAYFFVLLVMLGIALVMFVYFVRRGWLK